MRPTCPICGKPPEHAPQLHPFCSKRCADIDLGRWFSEGYGVPGRDGEAMDDGDSG